MPGNSDLDADILLGENHEIFLYEITNGDCPFEVYMETDSSSLDIQLTLFDAVFSVIDPGSGLEDYDKVE